MPDIFDEVSAPTGEETATDVFDDVFEETQGQRAGAFAPEDQTPQLSRFKGGFGDIITGKAETRPIETLLQKRPSELLRRPAAGFADLLEAISPSAPDPRRILGQAVSLAEAIRGERDLTPEEEEAGRQIETLTQLLTPIPGPKGVGKAEQVAKAAPIKELVKLPRIAEEGRKVSKLIKPKALPSTLKKTQESLIKEGEKALQSVKRAKIPIVKELEAGKPLEAITNKMLKKVSQDAETIPGKTDPKSLIEVINSKIKKFSKARTPSETEQRAINLGRKLVKDLSAEDLTMKELVGQFRSNNRASGALIEAARKDISQPESLEIYQSVNNAIGEEIGKNPQASDLFKKLFRTSNENFKQLRRIDEFDSLVQSALDKNEVFSPSKFNTILKRPGNQRKLRKIVGEAGLEDLRKISRDLIRAEDAVSKVKPLKLRELLIGAPLLAKYLGIPGSEAVVGAIAAKKALDIAYGFYLTKPKSRNLLLKFTNAVNAKDFNKAKDIAIKLELGFKREKKD